MIKLVSLPYPDSLDDKLDPPLGLLYIAAVLERNNYKVEIVDLAFIPRDQWGTAIGKPDILGVSIMTPTLHVAKEVLQIAKHNNPKTIVIAGGPHPSCLPFDMIKEGFDAAVIGEGENTFLDLVRGQQHSDFYIKKHPIIKSLPVDVNTLPLPARHLVNLKAYTRKVAGEPATTVITSRGCPYTCAFCDKTVHGEGTRFRNISNVTSEIKGVIREYGIHAFKFDDDTFTVNRKRLNELLYELRELNIVFRCQGNARTDTLHDFISLQKAGCREIIFGVESGSQLILDKIHKQVTVGQNRLSILNAKKAGLTVRANLMVGNPGETWKTVEETLNFIKSTEPQQWIISNFIPLPGCPIWNNPSAYGIKIMETDWKQYFTMAGKNQGGLTHATEAMSMADIAAARAYLIKNLPPQQGPQQNYSKELKK